jgi:hypothetical protein
VYMCDVQDRHVTHNMDAHDENDKHLYMCGIQDRQTQNMQVHDGNDGVVDVFQTQNVNMCGFQTQTMDTCTKGQREPSEKDDIVLSKLNVGARRQDGLEDSDSGLHSDAKLNVGAYKSGVLEHSDSGLHSDTKMKDSDSCLHGDKQLQRRVWESKRVCANGADRQVGGHHDVLDDLFGDDEFDALDMVTVDICDEQYWAPGDIDKVCVYVHVHVCIYKYVCVCV